MGADARQMMRALIAATVRSIKVALQTARLSAAGHAPRLCVFAQWRNGEAIPASPHMNLPGPHRD